MHEAPSLSLFSLITNFDRLVLLSDRETRKLTTAAVNWLLFFVYFEITLLLRLLQQSSLSSIKPLSYRLLVRILKHTDLSL